MKISKFYFGPGSPKNRCLRFFRHFFTKKWAGNPGRESRVRRPGASSETTRRGSAAAARRAREIYPQHRRRWAFWSTSSQHTFWQFGPWVAHAPPRAVFWGPLRNLGPGGPWPLSRSSHSRFHSRISGLKSVFLS